MHAKRLIGLLLVLMLYVACAAPPHLQREQAGELSQLSATLSYKAIYTAFKDGRLTAAQMGQADQLYEQWRVAQERYVNAARTGQPDISSERSLVLAALHRLLTFSADSKVL